MLKDLLISIICINFTLAIIDTERYPQGTLPSGQEANSTDLLNQQNIQ